MPNNTLREQVDAARKAIVADINTHGLDEMVKRHTGQTGLTAEQVRGYLEDLVRDEIRAIQGRCIRCGSLGSYHQPECATTR